MKKKWIRDVTEAERRLWHFFTRNDRMLHEQEKRDRV